MVRIETKIDELLVPLREAMASDAAGGDVGEPGDKGFTGFTSFEPEMTREERAAMKVQAMTRGRVARRKNGTWKPPKVQDDAELSAIGVVAGVAPAAARTHASAWGVLSI